MTFTIDRLFTRPDNDPFNDVTWESRTAEITNDENKTIFRQEGVEFPSEWSQLATNVVASKYFRGALGTPEREYSAKQLIRRVVHAITVSGVQQGYFDPQSANAFRDELTYIILHQFGTFNSPVWFNVGIVDRPQTSACFIVPVEDDLSSILKLAHTEAMIFKGGSGTGTNLSVIRSCRERLSSGGTASGPVSFMKGFDAFTGVIKSGGKTRRAAKMVILNIDHPDVIEFIRCKAEEERKAWALIDAGYDDAIDGIAYGTVAFQNGNNSVRISDEFMRAVLGGLDWDLIARTTGETLSTHKAMDILMEIAKAAHQCGDPGVQFDTTINDWNTCKKSGRINASNACTEVQFLDNSACNLATLNLLKFLDDVDFNITRFAHVVNILFVAQDIMVDMSSYPTHDIEVNAHKFRPLGINYANLGAMLMAMGMPYDSEQGRNFAASVTALMTGCAYRMSALLANHINPFPEFEKNKECMYEVIDKHMAAILKYREHYVGLLDTAIIDAWNDAKTLGSKFGFRNAQASLLAPTGTISFMMDCITTGIEPEFALVKVKKLVGGGYVKTVNPLVSRALKRFGYTSREIEGIEEHIKFSGDIGDSCISQEHIAIFDCAAGKRTISPMGHINMLAAVQPFLSGAISKTVNLPTSATPEEIAELLIAAWKKGIKAIAVYRDKSKRTQPLQTESRPATPPPAPTTDQPSQPRRRHLPDERQSVTHKFAIAGHEGYITVGMFEDGSPGEIFIRMSKAGSVVAGLVDSFALAISLALQYGVPLGVLIVKFSHMRFEPSGFTGNPQIPIAKSIMDYIFRWLAMKFSNGDEQLALPIAEPVPTTTEQQIVDQDDAPICVECGGFMTQTGTCSRCNNCGASSGCG